MFFWPDDGHSVLRAGTVTFRRPGLSAPRDEAVPALKLNSRRRIMGYTVPLLNMPLGISKAYEIYLGFQAGLRMNTPEFLNDIILLSLSLGITLLIPSYAPMYTSRYSLTGAGLRISRILKRTVTIPYGSIERMELYIRNEKRGKPSKEAVQYAKDAIITMRRTGFKFHDYTNAEENIALLFGPENKVYMVSPAYPKAFAQKLRKKAGRIPVRIVELTPRGKRIQDLAS